MRVFEDPWVVITFFVLCFVFLVIIGVFFAIRGMKTVTGKEEDKAFTSISKLESKFKKAAEQRGNRSVAYISISFDEFRGEQAKQKVLAELKRILLATFSNSEEAFISAHSEKSFIAFAKWDQDTAREKIKNCCSELNKCLVTHGVLNVVDVRIGACIAMGTQVSFDAAINRSKQACVLAKKQKKTFAEWDATSGKSLESILLGVSACC